MNARNALIFAAAFGVVGGLVAYFLNKQAKREGQEQPHSVNSDRGHDRVARSVQDTLQQHSGEDSPVVRAFKEAVQADGAS